MHPKNYSLESTHLEDIRSFFWWDGSLQAGSGKDWSDRERKRAVHQQIVIISVMWMCHIYECISKKGTQCALLKAVTTSMETSHRMPSSAEEEDEVRATIDSDVPRWLRSCECNQLQLFHFVSLISRRHSSGYT